MVCYLIPYSSTFNNQAFLGTPRTAATAFEMAAKPFLPEKFMTIGMLVFSAFFFIFIYFLTIHPNQLVKYVGKYLNTIFLVLLTIIFLLATFYPMGRLNHPAYFSYRSNALINGILEEYNTVDAVALIALSVTFVRSVRDLEFKNKQIAIVIAKSGLISILFETAIYFGLILLGVMSLNKLTLSENGSIALSEIFRYYLDNFGAILLGIMVTLGVFTTAMGLVVSFAQDFHKLFPKISYVFWLSLTTFISFIIANECMSESMLGTFGNLSLCVLLYFLISPLTIPS